jgi:hypothetical protein
MAVKERFCLQDLIIQILGRMEEDTQIACFNLSS